MGRISDLIPALYHGEDNDLIRFTNALDVEVDLLERQVKGITDLINVDKCPEDKLPYLAALTNCPLIGDDPVLWRKQIKNWPYILKLKGTQRSLEIVLDSVGAESWEIKTFFRDAGGGYVTEKPAGKLFKDNDGLWHNIRTHYFGVEFTLGKDFIEKKNFDWNIEEVEEKMRVWFEHDKPYHAELLNMLIIPPKILPDDHICRWDFCNWEHTAIIQFWHDLTPNDEIDFMLHDFIHSFERGVYMIDDISLWDVSQWDEKPFRFLQFGAFTESAFVCSLEWGEGEASLLSPNLWDYSKWDYVSSFTRVIGCEVEYFIPVAKFDETISIIGAFTYTDLICDLRPRWDARSWKEHHTWIEYVACDFVSEFVRGIYDSLDWNAKREYPASFWDKDKWDYVNYPPEYDAPLPKWSERKIWEQSNSWQITSELPATLEIDYQEE